MKKEQREQIEKLKKMPDSKIDFSDIPEKTNWDGAVKGKFFRPKAKPSNVAICNFEGGELPR